MPLPMQAGQPNTPQAQPGIEAILEALAMGGQPLGNIAQGGMPPVGATAGQVANPLAALDQLTPEMLQQLLMALQGGAFNAQNQMV